MGNVVATQVDRSETRRRSRNIEERLMVRFPRVWRALAALAQRLVNPRSRLRRTWLRRQVVSGWDAVSRRDFELMLVRYASDVEVEFDPEFAPLGLGEAIRGHDSLLQLIEKFGEAWERWEVRPVTVLDLGDRLAVLGTFRLPGKASGLELEREFAQLMTLRGGLVAREQWFSPWDRGLRAAELEPDAITRDSRSKAGPVPSSPAKARR